MFNVHAHKLFYSLNIIMKSVSTIGIGDAIIPAESRNKNGEKTYFILEILNLEVNW